MTNKVIAKNIILYLLLSHSVSHLSPGAPYSSVGLTGVVVEVEEAVDEDGPLDGECRDEHVE